MPVGLQGLGLNIRRAAVLDVRPCARKIPGSGHPGGRDTFQKAVLRRRKVWKTGGGMEGGWGGGVEGCWRPAVEKYSRFLQPPLPVSAGHDCDGKPGTKPWRENSFSSRPCCFVGFFKGLPYTIHLYCACMLWRIGRFGAGRFLFSCVICLAGGQTEFKAGYCQVLPLQA